MTNPSECVESEYLASIKISAPLVDKIIAQSHDTSDDANVQRLMHAVRKEKDDDLKGKLEELKVSLPVRTQRAVDLACEKGASSWLTAIPLKDMNIDLSKLEFRDALRLRYDRPIPDSPSVCVCGCSFTMDHAMICQGGGLVIQRHNEIRDLEAELLNVFIMGYVTFSLGCYMVCCSVASLAVGYIYLSCSHLYSFASYDRPYALKIKYPVIRGFFYT